MVGDSVEHWAAAMAERKVERTDVPKAGMLDARWAAELAGWKAPSKAVQKVRLMVDDWVAKWGVQRAVEKAVRWEGKTAVRSVGS